METQGDIGERETDGDRHPLQVPHILLVFVPWRYMPRSFRYVVYRARHSAKGRITKDAGSGPRLFSHFTMRLRIKNLEEKNRELTGLLELVYGKLALAREQNASVDAAP